MFIGVPGTPKSSANVDQATIQQAKGQPAVVNGMSPKATMPADAFWPVRQQCVLATPVSSRSSPAVSDRLLPPRRALAAQWWNAAAAWAATARRRPVDHVSQSVQMVCVLFSVSGGSQPAARRALPPVPSALALVVANGQMPKSAATKSRGRAPLNQPFLL
jgi:hypothetical protein